MGGGQSSSAKTNSILAFMSGQRASQVQYIQGMLGIGIFIVCFVCIWFLTLVVLKCSRDSRDRMGCAAGYAFHDQDTDTKQAYMYAQQQRRREHQEQASVMADVDDEDSIRRDNHSNTNTTKRNPKQTTMYSLSAVPGGSKPSSAERRALSAHRMSSLSMLGNGSRRVTSSLSSLFGKEPPQQQQQQPQQRSTQAPKPAEYYDDDNEDEEEDVPIWSVSAHPNRSMNYSHYRNSDNTTETHPQQTVAEEIELHMELDSIVRALTEEDSTEENTKTKNQGRRHPDRPVETLRSLPPSSSKRVWIGDESSTSSSHENSIEPYHKTTKMDKVWGSTACCSVAPRHVARRKILTRLVFGLFACVSLVCCALLMTHMYIPLEQAAQTSQTVVAETTIIVEELNTVLEIVNTTATTAIALMASTPLQYAVICPSFPVDEFALQFGFNPNDIIATMETEYTNYIPTVVNAITTAQSASIAVTQALRDLNEIVATTNDYLWILPVIICTTILIIFSQLALLLAVLYGESGKRGSIMETPKIENCYGYTIIPLQTVIVALSWLLVILFCFGIIVTFDSCLPAILTTTTNSITARENKMDVALDTTRDKIDGAYAELTGGRGTPDDTVLAVLDKYVTEAVGTSVVDDILYERLSTYVTGCGASTSSTLSRPNGAESGTGTTDTTITIQEPDPLEELIVIQALLRESLDYVATQVNFAKDVLGLDYIEEKCGRDNNQVQLFFTNLNLLNAQFEQVNMAITRSYNALNCPRIHTLYQEAVHQAFCTDVATANTNGLLLLIAISFSGMILITLRASWRSAT